MRRRAMIVFSVLIVLLLVAAPAAAAPAQLPVNAGAVAGPPAIGRYHVVRFGETLFSIGRRYGVSPWAIASANHLPNANRIFAGQCLYIPPRPVCPPARCGCGPRCGWGW